MLFSSQGIDSLLVQWKTVADASFEKNRCILGLAVIQTIVGRCTLKFIVYDCRLHDYKQLVNRVLWWIFIKFSNIDFVGMLMWRCLPKLIFSLSSDTAWARQLECARLMKMYVLLKANTIDPFVLITICSCWKNAIVCRYTLYICFISVFSFSCVDFDICYFDDCVKRINNLVQSLFEVTFRAVKLGHNLFRVPRKLIVL